MFFNDANAAQRAVRRLGGYKPMSKLFALTLHHLDGPVLRRTNGRRSVTSVLTGLPIVNLTTTGAKSGQPRTVPLIGVPDGEDLILVASNYGNTKHPAWYHNLVAHPECAVTVNGRTQRMTARAATGAERDRALDLDLKVYPARARYAQRTEGREIPVLILRPNDPI